MTKTPITVTDLAKLAVLGAEYVRDLCEKHGLVYWVGAVPTDEEIEMACEEIRKTVGEVVDY